jgi:cytochrome c oxidase subunit 3
VQEASIPIVKITIEFLADPASVGSYEFRPKVASMRIHPGKLYDTEFYAKNLTQAASVAQAVPSISPTGTRPSISTKPSVFVSARKNSRRARGATCRCGSSSIRGCRAMSTKLPWHIPFSIRLNPQQPVTKRLNSFLFPLRDLIMAQAHAPAADKYYVPHSSPWPIYGSVTLFILMSGAACTLNDWLPAWSLIPGFVLLACMFLFWFTPSSARTSTACTTWQVDRSFRMGMMWFIFSEVMFFAAFFGALFYARNCRCPGCRGDGVKVFTNLLLWPHYERRLAHQRSGHLGRRADGTFETVPAIGLPAINTADPAHQQRHGHHRAPRVARRQRGTRLKMFLALTFLLGFTFVGLLTRPRVHEAYNGAGPEAGTGIYGSTFFMLTGFHGLHVTVGAIMLHLASSGCATERVTSRRITKHFGFEAVCLVLALRRRGMAGPVYFRLLAVDNMTNADGRAGYFVITPFLLSDGAWLLVNRGWVPLGVSRAVLPDVGVSADERTLRGRADHLPAAGIQMGRPAQLTGPFPAVANFPSSLDIARLLNETSWSRAAEAVLLDADQPDGYVRQWQAPGFPPMRHIAYAVQWFGLALALIVIYIVTNVRRATRGAEGNRNLNP